MMLIVQSTSGCTCDVCPDEATTSIYAMGGAKTLNLCNECADTLTDMVKDHLEEQADETV